MDLEEIQEVWSEMSDQLEQQKKLTDKIILDMTQDRYTRKFSTISKIETFGAIICFIMAFYMLFNFDKLDIWYLQVCGAFSIAFLIGLPILTLGSLKNIQKINIAEKNIKDTLVTYSKAKNKVLAIQRLGIFLCYIFMMTCLPVFSKLMKDKDLFQQGSFPIWYVVIMGVFIAFFARWGYGWYKKITQSAEGILKELEIE
ncbi:hypothetical protein SB49_04170 [Sediminicola sp. YIK13]|uniref:hypothetical protein n=1 Tax=Sediminicola sp. YIK13 TaxID=1453352 RepID=UPI0007220F56|nr:hypothetical protein [Sediminicola sp. YIK13]ALM07085.1 hypothetical protein SB49_04170 [Sediminicola sp. YIK13]